MFLRHITFMGSIQHLEYSVILISVYVLRYNNLLSDIGISQPLKENLDKYLDQHEFQKAVGIYVRTEHKWMWDSRTEYR